VSGAVKGHEYLRYRPEHYLEAIHQLGPQATLTNVSKALGVKPSTARKMLLALERQGLVKYQGRGGITLTEEGLRRIRELDEVHRALAEFFKAIGVEEDLAEAEAEKLEHVIDRRVVEKIVKAAALLKALREFACPPAQRP